MIQCLYLMILFVSLLVSGPLPAWLRVVGWICIIGCYFATSIIWDKTKDKIKKLENQVNSLLEKKKDE